ncbi:MAG: molybdenum cofactor guanylyltransferase MobA [Spongiibacteraceae bacterium]
MTTIDKPSPSNITAVILAGGASTRMGRDKALLEWRDRPFIAHIIARLQPQVAHIAINTNNAAEFEQFGLPLIGDATAKRCGPLGGVLAALNYSATAWTLIVPCDNPLLSTQLVARLAESIHVNASDVAYAASKDDSHYLYALLRASLRDSLAHFMNGSDYAVRHWYASLRTSRVDFSDAAECFRNINNVDDLTQLPR